MKDYVSTFTPTKVGDYNEYSSAGAIVGPPLRSLIVKQMIDSKTKFTPKGDPSAIENLKLHISVRMRIVNEANAAASAGGLDGVPATSCALAVFTIYNTAYSAASVTMPSPPTALPKMVYDGVWIPGDWGYYKNKNWHGTDPHAWAGGLEGEHLIWIGLDGKAYAHGATEPLMTLGEVEAMINGWKSVDGEEHGDAELVDPVLGSGKSWRQPGVGLQLP